MVGFVDISLYDLDHQKQLVKLYDESLILTAPNPLIDKNQGIRVFF